MKLSTNRNGIKGTQLINLFYLLKIVMIVVDLYAGGGGRSWYCWLDCIVAPAIGGGGGGGIAGWFVGCVGGILCLLSCGVGGLGGDHDEVDDGRGSTAEVDDGGDLCTHNRWKHQKQQGGPQIKGRNIKITTRGTSPMHAIGQFISPSDLYSPFASSFSWFLASGQSSQNQSQFIAWESAYCQ